MKKRTVKKPFSAKARVLKKYPEAYAYQWSGPHGWTIYAARNGAMQGLSLNVGDPTPQAAWASALFCVTEVGKVK